MTTANGNAPQVANNGGASKPFKIFISYDSREDEAYAVCHHSNLKRTSITVEITLIVQSNFRVHTTL
ncbi:cadmium 2+ induced [Hibiscus trionum]|uniref:Cadmium 2+ induced n=1 Tax=Hibiscus trionum TaxID=183268 RepID=A0A9W7LGP5_HIBTR|nr:cadmium 2+ induced [Hibiscus trionum]